MRWATVGLLTVLNGAALAVGAVHPATLAVAALVVAAVSGWIFARSRAFVLPAPALVMGSLGVWSLVQAIPLPISVVRALSPDAAVCWTEALRLTDGVLPKWASISYAPSGSVQEAAKWLCYASTFCVAAAISRAQRSARWAAWGVLTAATVVALVTLAHGLMASERLYGLYAPSHTRRGWALSPLLNANVLAGFLNLGTLAGLGVLLADRRIWTRIVAGFSVSACVATSLIAASRGGIVALVLGLGAFGILSWRQSVRRRRLRGPLMAGSLAVLAGLVFVALAKNRAPLDELRNLTIDKLVVFDWTLPLVAAHWPTGVGRGAFESVFPAYATPERHLIYPYAENFLLQWAAEWGVPVTAAALLSAVLLLRPKCLGATKSPVSSAVFAALVMVAAQNLVDISTEIPAPMIAVSVLVGAAWGAASATVPVSGRSARVGVLLAALSIVAALFVIVGFRTTALSERSRVHSLLGEGRGVSTNSRREIEDMVRRFPADPYFPRMMGLTLMRTNDPSILRWVGYALERDPTSGRSHVLLAHALHKRGATAQALVALRSAAQFDDDIVPEVSRLLLSWSPNPDSWPQYAPAGANGARLLTGLSSTLPAGSAERLATLKQAYDLHDSPTVRVALARTRVEALELDTALCTAASRETCIADTERLISTVPSEAIPDDVVEVRARLEVQRGNAAGAERLLETACRSPVGACARVWAGLAAARGDLWPTVEKLLSRACPPSGRCAHSCDMLADVAARHDDHAGAARLLKRGAEQDPSLERWERAGDAAVKAERHADAVYAYRQAARLAGAEKEKVLRSKADSERQKLGR